MVQLIRKTGNDEGEIFNKWLHSRLIRRNKNVLGATTGPTGSGKSYQDLRKAELWYRYHFKEDFPTQNICFSVAEVMKRLGELQEGKIRKGDILIFEEAGANIGSLDFQSQISKMFTYVLQSFRSLNIGIFFNVPYLSMVNKTARLLMHYHFVTNAIDGERKVSICKPFFLQINQQTGKIYPKYPRVKYNGRTRVVKRFSFALPEERLVLAYEQKKKEFLSGLTEEFKKKLEKFQQTEIMKMGRKEATAVEKRIMNLTLEGYKLKEIGEMIGTSPQNVHQAQKRLREKGFKLEKPPIPLGINPNQLQKPIPAAS